MVCKRWCLLFCSSEFRRLRDALQTVAPAAPPPICVLEYQPGHHLPSAGHPLPSAVSYIQQARGLQRHNISLSFLPRDYWLFSPWNFITQDGLICIFKPLAGAASLSSEGVSAVWRLNFCVANPVTRTWRELPPYGQEHVHMRRRDWRVEMQVEKSNAIAHFRVMLLMRRLMDGKQRMCVHTFSSKTGTWNMVSLEGDYHGQQMQGAEQWPRYVFSKASVYSLSLQRARGEHEIFVHEMQEGRILESRDVTEIHDPCKFMVRCDGVLCAGENVWWQRMELLMRHPTKPETRVGLWHLNAHSYMWHKVADLPWQLEQSLLQAPGLGNRRTKARSPERRLSLDSAILDGDTVVFTLEVQHCVDLSVTRLWTNLVAYHLNTDCWEVVCHGLPSQNNGCGRHEICPEFLDLGLGLRPEEFHNPYHVFVPCFNDLQ